MHFLKKTVQLSPQFHAMPGAGYGVRQSVLSGHITLNMANDSDLAWLVSLMNSILDKPIFSYPYEGKESIFVYSLLKWCVLLQNQQHIPVFGDGYLYKEGDAKTAGRIFSVAFPYASIEAALQSLLWLSEVVNKYSHNNGLSESDHQRVVKSYSKLQQRLRKFSIKGVNTFHFLTAARALNISFVQVLPGIFQFGTGKYSRLLHSTQTDRTPALGVAISQDKAKTAGLLNWAGLPVPQHKKVTSASKAVEFAEVLGYPVVVKPADRGRGAGVSINLKNANQVKEAFLLARQFSKNVLLEKYHQGERFRFNIYKQQVINVFYRHPLGIVGNGLNTIAELVEMVQNSQQGQRYYRLTGKVLLALDEEAKALLLKSNLTESSVLMQGQNLPLRNKNNVSTEGRFDLLEGAAIHPDNIHLAIRAAKVMHLDFAGVDFITTDIEKSWLEMGGVICEVNSKPQIGDTLNAEQYQNLLRDLIGEVACVPVHLLVYSAKDACPLPEDLRILLNEPACTAFSSVDGLWINGEKVAGKFANGYLASRALMSCCDAESILSVMSVDEVLRFGLAVDHYDSIRLFFARPDAGGQESVSKFEQLCRLLQGHTTVLKMGDQKCLNV